MFQSERKINIRVWVETNRTIIERVIMLVLFAAATFIVFNRCRFGYVSPDEGFYPTDAWRVVQGDKILWDIWDGCQTSGFVAAPLIWLFTILNRSTEGVYLFIRYAYSVCKLLISLLIFFKFKRYTKWGAYISALVFYMYTGYGQMTLNYNTIMIGGGVVACVLLFNDKDSISARISWILSGVALSVSVLGIPQNAIAYVAYVIAVIAISSYNRAMKKKGRQTNDIIRFSYSYKALGFVSIGVAVSACVFFAYVLRSITLSQMIIGVGHVFGNLDPTHQVSSVYRATFSYFVRILICNHHNFKVFAVYVAMAIVTLGYMADKKKNQRRGAYICTVSLLSIVLIVTFMMTENIINAIVLVPNVLAILLLFIDRDRQMYPFYGVFVFPGIVMSYAEYVASNGGFPGIASVSCIATVGSIIVIILTIRKYFEEINISDKAVNFNRNTLFGVGALAAFVFAVIVSMAYYKTTYIYWKDGKLPDEYAKIEYGVYKGIYFSPEQAEQYYAVYRDTEVIRSLPEDSYVVYAGDHYLYFAGMQRCGSYNTLGYDLESNPQVLYTYYEEHPEKVADAVYVYNSHSYSYALELSEKFGYSIEEVPTGWVLMR